MRRIFLYFHIRRSERKRVLIAFGSPILVWIILSGISARVKKTDMVDLENRLDSLVSHQQSVRLSRLKRISLGPEFMSDTCSEQFWLSTGLSAADASRLLSYQKAGGKIKNGGDLERLGMGDSVWRFYVKPRVMDMRPSSVESWHRPSNDYSGQEVKVFSVLLNDVDSLQLSETGLPKSVQYRWLKFQSRGGRFKAKEELLRIYGLDSNWFEEWKDSLVIMRSSADSTLILTMNKVDSATLVDVFFLPPWRAKSYVSYRTALRGFVNKEQLWDLKLDSNLTFGLFDLEMDPVQFVKLSLNEISKEELLKHPYVSWQAANSILFYRTKVRPIESLDQLVGLEGISEEELERLSWYFE